MVFRLRTLMIVVLLVALVIGWRANRAYTQRQAVARIKAANGSFTYDFQVFPLGTPPAVRKAAKPPGPDWLRRWLGDEYFQDIAGVAIRGPVNAETMAAICRLDHLETIEIVGPLKVGDGLENFRGSNRLRVVRLSGPAVTDSWLATLANCPNLERLELNGADVSDAGLAQLAGLTKLAALGVLNSPKVTDATVENVVPTLPSLATLNLGTSVSDRSMPTLGKLSQLEFLVLSRSRVTDQGIGSLKGLTGLLGLMIDHSAVTDAGLASLSEMTSLVQLNLSDTKITGVGFEHLNKLQRLSLLRVDGTDLSDDAMPFVAKLGGLQTLYAERTKVSDAGLVSLQGTPGLSKLFVGSSRVTDQGLAAFQKGNSRIKFTSNKLESRSIITPPKSN